MNFRGLLLAAILILPVSVFGQPSAGGRACNLQAREIALRISEEVSNELTAEERGQIVAIAEEVCMDIASPPRVARPNAPAEAETPTATPEAPVEGDEEGLFGDLRIIDPEDRVRRPGLKRR